MPVLILCPIMYTCPSVLHKSKVNRKEKLMMRIEHGEK